MKLYLTEARQLLILAIPVILAQVSQTAMGVLDTVMAGAVSATDMAAVAVGTSIWLPVILLGHGLLQALTPTVAQLNGAGLGCKIAMQVRQSFWLAFFMSVFSLLILWQAGKMIHFMPHIDPNLASIAERYLHALMWGAPGYLFFQTLRNQCEGMSFTLPSMVLGFIGLLINIPLNYIFIYGHLGMPALGGVGCGVATASVYWLMFLVLRWWIIFMPRMRDIRNNRQWSTPDWTIIVRLFRLGLPVAMALFFEVTLFAVVALLVSPLGIVDVAGHQIALNYSSLMFVVPLSMGVAATIRVGYKLGQGSVAAARIAAWTAQGVGLSLVACTALFSVLFREQIALLYNKDPQVVLLATQLMFYSAIYQFSDSLQVIGSGILRGYKDTKAIFFITFFSYWIIGLPLGYLLALTDTLVNRMGPAGFWCGFIAGLTSAAILMIWRIIRLQRQSDSRILARSSR